MHVIDRCKTSRPTTTTKTETTMKPRCSIYASQDSIVVAREIQKVMPTNSANNNTRAATMLTTRIINHLPTMRNKFLMI